MQVPHDGRIRPVEFEENNYVHYKSDAQGEWIYGKILKCHHNDTFDIEYSVETLKVSTEPEKRLEERVPKGSIQKKTLY